MSVDIELYAIKNSSKDIWDIGNIVDHIHIVQSIHDNAGSMEISYVKNSNLDLEEGDLVTLNVNGRQFFYGWIFQKTVSAFDNVKLKVYDAKRYLAYKDVDIVGKETIDKLFERLCKRTNMKYKVIDKSSFIIPTKIHDPATLNDMLEYGIDQTFIGTSRQEWFCVRANWDTLELVECSKRLTDVIIGDKCLLTDYQFSSDIENTYNAFKIQREIPSDTQQQLSQREQITKRKNFTAQDNETIKKWGLLHYYEKKDAKWTDAQINDYLAKVAVRYNTKTKSLKINALGDLDCIAGNMVTLMISDLKDEKAAQGVYYLITNATHDISHNDHTMSLDVQAMDIDKGGTT